MFMSKRQKGRLPKYVVEDVDRYGTVRVYLRRPGHEKVLLHGSPWSEAFMIEYGKALHGDVPQVDGAIEPVTLPTQRPQLEATHGTWKWLCQEYMKSERFKKLTGTTPKTRRLILESTWKEPINPKAKELFGDMPIHRMGYEQVLVLCERKAKFATAANDRRKIMGYVFRWGKKAHRKLVLVNPVRDVERFEHTVTNVPPWFEAHFHQFMAKYGPGSKERRAMALHLYTGARGCDVRHFGPQHMKNGRFAFTQQKTGGDVDVPVLEELARELALAPKDSLAFILTEYGKTFSQKGYGNWFNGKCRDAGLVDRTAHGIRAGAATIAANNGASIHQLMSMFGWVSESMAIRYTKQADKKRLADSGMPLIKLEQIAS
jgi:integrase